MIEDCAALRLQTGYNQNMSCTLMRSVRRFLTADSCCRAEVDVEEIGTCLQTTQGKSPDLQGG